MWQAILKLWVCEERKVQNIGHVVSSFGLASHGLTKANSIFWNLDASQLYEQAIIRAEGKIAKGGAFVTLTGQHTGRSPNDRFIVRDEVTEDDISWGNVNQPISIGKFEQLYEKIQRHISGRDLFVQDCYAGADKAFRLPVRVVTENSWHSLFARNMFIQPPDHDLENFEPQFTVIQLPSLEAEPGNDGTNSSTFIVVNLTKKLILIGGSAYAGEIKKSIFSVMNFLLPPQNVLPMHCSSNMGVHGDTAVFFGLSGTGKTTLSADPLRTLIGDDEHGWGPGGVFNFEGGCYAKTINLTREAEPEIFQTTQNFGSIIENVMMNEESRQFDFFDTTYSENGRVSYDINNIPNASKTGAGAHPSNIIMLTCDAFGVLPPVSKLTSDQAMYHFLSGYTAKVAGTERGLKEPTATFSACFGAPFMPRHPTVYASLLGEKMSQHETTCWLINTGWSGGEYGEGERIQIRHTRAMVEAVLENKIPSESLVPDKNFGMHVPTSCPGIPEGILNARSTWPDDNKYDLQAQRLASLFEENFKAFENYATKNILSAAIKSI